jgi:HK97 family phage prohead protease
MPWHIQRGGGTCSADEYAVIKNSDGSTAGCHPTPEAAKKQIAALYANDKNKKGSSMKRSLGYSVEEQRGLPADVAAMEIRQGYRDDGKVEDRFHGYAMVWGSRASIGNPHTYGFYEECTPGMVTKTLREGDQRFFIDHNPYYIISRISAGTLRLTPDDHGLLVDSALDENLSYVRDYKANVRNKNITGMSFGMRVIKDEWSKERTESRDGKMVDVEVRKLLEVQLVEVSGVTFPAYTATHGELKTVAAALRNRGDIEAIEFRAEYRPELLEMCGLDRDLRPTVIDLRSTAAPEFMSKLRQGIEQSEPDSSTRSEHQEDHTEPVASTQLLGPSVASRMRAMAARYHLPAS